MIIHTRKKSLSVFDHESQKPEDQLQESLQNSQQSVYNSSQKMMVQTSEILHESYNHVEQVKEEVDEEDEPTAGDPSKDPFLAKLGNGRRSRTLPNIRNLIVSEDDTLAGD